MESHLAALGSGEWSELELIVERFEATWRRSSVPDLAEYLPEQSILRCAAICELAATDLEWRWQSGLTARVEDYLFRFSELSGNSQVIVQLATCEFLARRRAGSNVDMGEFLERFPQVAGELRSALAGACSASEQLSGDDVDTSDSGAAPRRVGRYELGRKIGEGSFGTIYEGLDTQLGRRVAVKLPRRAFDARSQVGARSIREAHNLARLSHPAIVPVLDAGWADGLFYIVCALIDGPTLADRIRGGLLERRTAAILIATIADALDYAHRQGIVHRDVKPSNILCDAAGSPWLTDFGLAVCRDSESTLTVEGQLLGTLAYMAPEQVVGQSHELDRRSDVYSLGAVLYEALTSQLPFVGSPSAILEQIRVCDPLPPTRVCPQIDRDLEIICLTALEKHPADRYQTAAELGDDLRRYLAGEPIHARPASAPRRLIKWARRHPAIAALASVTLAALVAVACITWWHSLKLRQALAQTDDARQLADDLRAASELSQHRTESLLYAADLRLATNSYYNGDVTETLRRLSKYLPQDGAADRREFIWRRLWSLCHTHQGMLTGHAGDVYTAQIIGDGHRCVTAGRDGTLRLWNLAGSPESSILGKYPDELGFAAVSPDAVTLATGGDRGIVRFWNLATRRETGQFVAHASWAVCGAISPGGDVLATSGRDKVIRLWTIPEGKMLAELVGHTSTVESVAFLAGGNSLVSTGADCTLRLWDLAVKQGSVVATYQQPAFCVACSHDGRLLATASADHNVYLWDVETGSQRGCLRGHNETVQSVAFSPDDKHLASTGNDCTVRVWDLAQLAESEMFIAHHSRVWSVAWFPDGARLISAGADGTVRLWRHNTSRLERITSLPAEVTRVWLPAGERRVWTQTRNGVYSVDATNNSRMLVMASGGINTIASSAAKANLLATAHDYHDLRLFHRAQGELLLSHEAPVRVASLAMTPSGDLLAIGGDAGELQLYEIPLFRLRWSRTVHHSRVMGIEFTAPGDALVITGAADNFVAVVRAADGDTRRVIDTTKLRPNVLDVALSPDQRLLATGCVDRAIHLWDPKQGTELTCLQGHNGAVQSVAFSPDGETLAAGTLAGSVTFWHVETWQELGTFKTSLAAVNDLEFSADGNTLAIGGRTADGGGQLLIWETKAAED